MREMKDSGVEWIGDVPVTWDLVQTKTVVSCKNEKSDYNGATYIGLEHIESGSGKLLTEGKQVDLVVDSTVSSFSASDVLFGKLRPYLAKVAKPDFSGQCSTEILVLSPSSQIYRNYLFWYMINPAFIEAVNSSTYGAKMPRANWSFIGSCIMPLPPLQIQKGISDFLDKKCAQVDALMANVQTQIEKLKAYKQSLITEVVTKGLDTTVPMKDSGVEWIGEIPEHWQIIRFRFIAKITTGNQDTQNAEPDGAYPFYVRSPIVERCNAYTFDGEGILMAGDGAGAGRVFHLADGKYAVHQRVYRFYDFKYMDPVLLKLYLENLFSTVMDYGSAKTTVPSVRLPMIQDFFVCVPPENEQQDMITVLSEKVDKIEKLISIKQSKIEKLEQYKRSLIYEYVTGKKEVP